MTIQEKAQKIGTILDELYPDVPPPLSYSDPYMLLIAVLLSAQCTDKKVNQVAPKLFELASTPSSMVGLQEESIREIIRPLGLAPSKATNIFNLSVILLKEFGGFVPNDLKALESLPGVGHKTASVVMSQCFGVPAFPVDTHIQRLSVRWGLSDSKNVRKTEEHLKRLFPENEWGKRHLQIIMFGRERCRAVGHDPNSCPICSWAKSK